ncbi:LysR family transcriptional regulator [Luteibacter yeojuensis]|uniref:LysR family transcriptional regulator n=1 Tax=Luteibacter yeojuensis TaxID=345309 RepID=A0A7X5QVU8_9GAMM|nr:LysR family transcriptional regulator [Luteibacter yeojuensis]NID16245.1 LysR family transcriptional regulator [Luteibacter yeojuensis]
MDRFETMRLFVRIVERRSFTLAASDLDLPRSTATQAIKRLETRLGVRLLQRTTRHVSPTLDGEAYHRRCVAILADIEDAEAAFVDARPTGMLRVDMHGTLARTFVLPALPEFLARYPGLRVHLGEGDRWVDLVREGVDCVLRVGDLHDSSMVGRRLAMLEEVTCASPDYLARHGTPQSLADLDGHVAIGFLSTATGSIIPLEFMEAGGLRQVTLPSVVSVAGAETNTALARLGLGLTQVPRYHVAADLAAGRLVEVLPDLPPRPSPVSLLYPQSRQLSPRVRVFIDWVSETFRARAGDGVRMS